MTLGQSNYSIGVEGYSRPTPKKLKLWADILLLAGLLVDIVNLLPLDTIPEFPGREWVVWGLLPLATVFKFVTKYVYEHKVEVPKVDDEI